MQITPVRRWPEQPPIPQRDGVLIVYNKCDLPERVEHCIAERYFPLSAQTGEGLEEFLRRILDRLIPHPLEPLTPVPMGENEPSR